MSTPTPQQGKAAVIVAQVFISCIMAFCMTFIFSIWLPLQFHPGWVADWMRNWLTAWPVAFVFSMVVGPISFKLSFGVLALMGRTRRT